MHKTYQITSLENLIYSAEILYLFLLNFDKDILEYCFSNMILFLIINKSRNLPSRSSQRSFDEPYSGFDSISA